MLGKYLRPLFCFLGMIGSWDAQTHAQVVELSPAMVNGISREYHPFTIPSFEERRNSANREMLEAETVSVEHAKIKLVDPWALHRHRTARNIRLFAHNWTRSEVETVINNRFDAVDVRLECCRALANIADERAVDFLLEAADDPRLAGTILVHIAGLLGTEVPLMYRHQAPPIFVPPVPSSERSLPIVTNAEGLQTIVNPRSFNFIAEDTKQFYARWQAELREYWQKVKTEPDHGFKSGEAYDQLQWDPWLHRHTPQISAWDPACQLRPGYAWGMYEQLAKRFQSAGFKETYFESCQRLYPGISPDGVPDQDYHNRYHPRIKLPPNVAVLRQDWSDAFGTPQAPRDGLSYAQRELSSADKLAIETAAAVLNDPLSLERLEAVQVLNLFHHQAALPSLKQVTTNTFEAVDLRCEACRALANIPDPAVVPALLAAADDIRVAGVALTTVSGIVQLPPRLEYANGDKVAYTVPLPRYGHVHSFPFELDFRYAIRDKDDYRTEGGRAFYESWQIQLRHRWMELQPSKEYTFDPRRRALFDFILRDWGDKIFPLPLFEDHQQNLSMWASLGVKYAETTQYEFTNEPAPAPYGNATALETRRYYYVPPR